MTSGANGGDRLAALEARLAVLEAREQIWQLMIDYRRELDRRDFAAYARLFTEDGEWLGNLGVARGPAAIEALLLRTLEGWSGEANAHLHLVDNAVIHVDGDTATAESTWVYVTRDVDDRPQLALIGHYEDVIVRDGDRWRFKRRVAYCDFPYEKLELPG